MSVSKLPQCHVYSNSRKTSVAIARQTGLARVGSFVKVDVIAPF